MMKIGIEVMNKLEYLDLAINKNNKYNITVNKSTHTCYFEKQFEHSLHVGKNADTIKILNTIVDLIISLAMKLEEKSTTTFSNSEQRILGSLNSIKTQSDRFIEKIDFIKGIHDQLIKRFDKIQLSELPLKSDLVKLGKIIEDNTPKDLETNSKKLLEQIIEQNKLNQNKIDSELINLKNFLEEIKTIVLS